MSDITGTITTRYGVVLTAAGQQMINEGRITAEQVLIAARFDDVEGSDHDTLWHVVDASGDDAVVGRDTLFGDEATLVGHYNVASDDVVVD